MTQLLRLSIVLLGLLLLAACGQPAPALLLDDGAGLLDAQLVEAAAAPLLASGASVAIFTAAQGGAADFADRLGQRGLLRGAAVAPNVVAIYISQEPRYSELRVGERWSAALSSQALEQIREGQLNPALRGGDFGAGLVAALGTIDQAVAKTAWQERAGGWIGLGLLVMPLVFVLFSFFSDQLAASPPGRLLAWLWALTPIARRRARQRLAQEIGIARRDCERLAQQARESLAKLAGRASELPAALAALEQRRATLQAQPATAGLLAEQRQLRGEIERLSKQIGDLVLAYERAASAAGSARSQLEQAQAAFGRALASPKPARKPKAKGQRGPTPEQQAQLDTMFTQLAELKAQHVALGQQPLAAAEQQAALEQLGKALRSLGEAGRRLYEAVFPPQRRAADSYSEAASAGTTAYAASGSSSGSDSSSSSDWSSSSDSGGESRAGGDW